MKFKTKETIDTDNLINVRNYCHFPIKMELKFYHKVVKISLVYFPTFFPFSE